MNNNDYEVRGPSEEEIPIVNSLMEQYFYPEEAILQCLLKKHQSVLTQFDFDQMKEDLRAALTALILNYGASQVAVYKATGEIVGASVMLLSENPKHVPDDERSVDVFKAYPPKSPFIRDYFHYLNDIIVKANLFTKFPEAKRFVESYALVVNEEHRKNGLAALLITEGIEWAWRNGMDVSLGISTSLYSKRAAEKVGIRSIMNLDLLEYKDTDGSSVFEEWRGQHTIWLMAVTRTSKQ